MKKFLSIFIVIVVIMGILLGCSSDTSVNNNENEVLELKLGHIMPGDHPNGLGAEEFSRLVNKKSNGKINISVFPSSQLGQQAEIFDAVELGTIDFALIGFGDPALRFPEIGILDAPFLANDREHLVRILNSEVMNDIYEETSKHMRVKVLAPLYYGARYLTTKDMEVHGPDDIKGLNIRVPDQKLYIETLTKMGAKPTPMDFSEVFLSLQQGVIDGQENPLSTIAANKFDQVQKYLIKTEHIIGANALYMSTKTYDNLSDENQKIIEEASKEVADYINKLAFEEEDKYLQELTDKGMILIENVDKESFKKMTKDIYNDFNKELVNKLNEIE